MTTWLRAAEVPFAIVVTKIDKVSPTKRMDHYKVITQALGLGQDTPFFPTSATKREGTRDMHAWVGALLEAAREGDND